MRLAALIVLGVAACAAFPAGATAQVRAYHVLKCHAAYLHADEAGLAGRHPSYQAVNDCSPKVSDYKLGIKNIGAAGNNSYSQYTFTAPGGTVIDRVCLQHRLRRQSNHRAELTAYPGFPRLEAGGDQAAGWSGTECYDLNHYQFIIRLACSRAGGCDAGLNAHAYVRNIELHLGDPHVPAITSLSGRLAGTGGWLRGVQSLEADANDFGAGVIHTVAYVNGVEVGRVSSDCRTGGLLWPRAVQLAPCPGQSRPLDLSLNTAGQPFRAGMNTVTVYAADFAGNPRSISRTVKVDNLPPHAAFRNSQDAEDPELIRAEVDDSHSGVRSASVLYRPVGGVSWHPLETRLEAGEARARIDSAQLPPGDYEFKAEVTDATGNEAATGLRENGTPMRLSLPLRAATELDVGIGRGRSEGRTVPYGTSTTVRGRLTDAAGEPIVNREIVVTEYFGEGALIRERPTSVITNERGAFKARVPAGPSRSIEADFAGTQKYLPAAASAGNLAVRSRVIFKTSRKAVREGGVVRFKGLVGRLGARVPAGGKLAELQVRVKTGRWDTVKEAFRTSASGRYRLSYRFGRHYTADAAFRFRVKVQSEGGWPFERAVSKQRRVVVRAN